MKESQRKNQKKLEEILEYSFVDPSLLTLALTHTSYANENFSGDAHRRSNQRLEFLGDSVLSVGISTYIYQNCPDLPEGKLSKLRAAIVCESTLADIARQLSVNGFLLLGVGEVMTNGAEKPSILADAMESIIAAVYLDGGFDAANRFILRHFTSTIQRWIRDYSSADYKTNLQELIGKNKMVPHYSIVDAQGPAHERLYIAQVEIDGGQSATGEGRTKKDAEQMAACAMLKRLKDS